MKLFLNPGNSAHLRGLADDFGESTNAVRLELNRFEEAGMILSQTSGNKKLYKANDKHPLFADINSLLLKYVGIDKVIDIIIGRIGDLHKLYITGDYAQGKDSGIIDLIFVGNLNKQYLVSLVEKAEKLISKKIRYITYEADEWEDRKSDHAGSKVLMIWEKPGGDH